MIFDDIEGCIRSLVARILPYENLMVWVIEKDCVTSRVTSISLIPNRRSQGRSDTLRFQVALHSEKPDNLSSDRQSTE